MSKSPNVLKARRPGASGCQDYGRGRVHEYKSQVRVGGSRKDGYLNFRLTVEALPGFAPLANDVTFYLHPTFSKDVIKRTVRGGKATLTRWRMARSR
jgi:hypothetical protein